ncbi:HEAT repeat domain-containing protein [Isosphaera pallida]|nr:HEAT repeat domain-containing protein [Isosphaera pallida]
MRRPRTGAWWRQLRRAALTGGVMVWALWSGAMARPCQAGVVAVGKVIDGSTNPPSWSGARVMAEPPHVRALIVSAFDDFVRHQNIDQFLSVVSARYTEGTLERLLCSDDARTRRAAVMALGHLGSFAVNDALARCLSDPDPSVRELAHHALWAIWFRADTPSHNARLEKVRECNARGRHELAIRLASDLIEHAPRFAEAYNQRAIAHFCLDRFEESVRDCVQALVYNPNHFGAMQGMGQCLLRLNRREEALGIFRRACKLMPYNHDLKQWVEVLEAEAEGR